MRAGDHLTLFNGEDGEFSAVILHADRKSVTVQLADPLAATADPLLPIHLGLGISRGERMDYAIQKATELGVSSIAPLFSEHCEVRLAGERADKRQAHWRQVAISACEQSGRTRVPEILAPQPLSTWLAAPPCPLRLVFD